jgi:hypothetical protein
VEDKYGEVQLVSERQDTQKNYDEDLADYLLFADALNVRHETSMTVSQILDELINLWNVRNGEGGTRKINTALLEKITLKGKERLCGDIDLTGVYNVVPTGISPYSTTNSTHEDLEPLRKAIERDLTREAFTNPEAISKKFGTKPKKETP